MYFLTEEYSEKSKGIGRDARVTGSLVIDKPKPGKGVNFYFNAVAHKLSLEEETPSLLPLDYNEREKLIRALCAGREDYHRDVESIVAEQSHLRLHRIVLTDAWYNGGVWEKDVFHEISGTKTLRIVGDAAIPLLRRSMVPAGDPVPDNTLDLSYEAMLSTPNAVGGLHH